MIEKERVNRFMIRFFVLSDKRSYIPIELIQSTKFRLSICVYIYEFLSDTTKFIFVFSSFLNYRRKIFLTYLFLFC